MLTHVILASGARESHLRTAQIYVASGRASRIEFPIGRTVLGVPNSSPRRPQEPPRSKVTPGVIGGQGLHLPVAMARIDIVSVTPLEPPFTSSDGEDRHHQRDPAGSLHLPVAMARIDIISATGPLPDQPRRSKSLLCCGAGLPGRLLGRGIESCCTSAVVFFCAVRRPLSVRRPLRGVLELIMITNDAAAAA